MVPPWPYHSYTSHDSIQDEKSGSLESPFLIRAVQDEDNRCSSLHECNVLLP